MKDKQVTLSGIANAMQKALPDAPYLTGLWKDDLEFEPSGSPPKEVKSATRSITEHPHSYGPPLTLR